MGFSAKKHEKPLESLQGGEHDMLKRLLDVAAKSDVDLILNTDGDYVFCEPELMDKTVQACKKTGADFIKWKDLPFGHG